MTNALAIIIAAVAATLFGVLIVRAGTGRRRDTRVMHRDPDHWLAEAGTAVATARRIAAELPDIQPTTAAPSTDTTDELDRLTARMAELSANAPTTMDSRVCRNLAVRSKALSTALSSPQAPGRHPITPPSDHQRTEFETAIGDLANHVELL